MSKDFDDENFIDFDAEDIAVDAAADAGEEAAESAGETAGKSTGKKAAETIGEKSGKSTGEKSGETAAENAGSAKRSKKGWTISFWICLIIFAAAVVGIIAYQMGLRRGQDTLEDLAEEVSVSADAEVPEETGDAEESADASVEIPIDFEALWEENEDIYAWLYIEDTVIDYPVLRSEEEEDNYYLNVQVDGTSGLPGSIYTQASYNNAEFTDFITVIYGHNMRNDTMFGSLSEYTDEDYREEHSTIVIYTPEHILTYEVVFTVTYDNRLIPYYYDVTTSYGFSEFLESLTTVRYIPSWVSDEVDEIDTESDRILVLSTCNGNSSQRFLVGALLTEEQ